MLFRLLAATVSLIGLATPAVAQNPYTWNTTTGTWNTAANWLDAGSNAVVPPSANTTQLVFNDSGTGYTATNDIGAFTLNRMTFNNTGTGAITIAGSPTTNVITLAGTTPTLSSTGTGAVTISHTLAGGGYTKTGSGTITLSGTNTVTGTINLNAGTLQVNAAARLGSTAANGLTINFNGGTLRTTASYTNGANVQIYNFLAGGGTIDVASGTLTKNGDSFTGSGSFVKVGTGTLSIGSAGGTGFTGGMTVNAGVVRFTSQRLSNAAAFTVNPGGQVQINDDATANFRIVAGGVLTLNGAGPGGSTPGALALTDQSGTSGTVGGPITTWINPVTLASPSTVGVFNGSNAARTSSLILSEPVTGPGDLIKAGNGFLTLSNAGNAYGGASGSTTVLDGTLRIGGGADRLPTSTTLILGDGATNTSGTFDLNGQSQTLAGLTTAGTGTANRVITGVAGTPTLTVNHAGAGQTFGGILGGPGANNNAFNFTKSGAGTLTLTGVNTYSGTTTVASGTLAISATGALSANSPQVFVTEGAVLDFSGTAGGYTIPAGQTLTVGRTGTPGNDVLGGLTVAGSLDIGGVGSVRSATFANDLTLDSATVRFDLSPNPASGNDLVAVAGNLGLSGSSTLDVNLTGGGLGSGNYTLFTYGGTLTGGAGNLTLVGTGGGTTRQVIALDTVGTPGAVLLSVSGSPSNLVWVGGANGNAWDLITTSNWSGGAGGDNRFYNLDTVTFDGTGVGGATPVALTGDLAPGTVLVTGSQNYTFGGSGRIVGTTTLTKQGTGTLTVLTNNTYTGLTTVSGGTLRIGGGGTTGSLTGGDLVNNAAVVFDRSDDIAFGGGISGSGSLTKGGSNTLTFTGPYTLSGDTTISGGTLALDTAVGYTTASRFTGAGALRKLGAGTVILTGDNDFAGGTTISAGVLQVGNGGANGAIGTGDITNGGGLTFNRSGSLTYAGVISGSGTLTQAGPGTTILTGANTLTGLTTISAGTLQLGDGTSTGTVAGNVAVGAAGTLVVFPAVDVTYPLVISGAGTIDKLGSATLTLTGSNSFTGTVNINGGTVVLDDQGAGGDLNAASIVVNNGGRFSFGPSGNPDLPGNTVITLNAGGTAEFHIGEDYGGINLLGGTYSTRVNNNFTSGVTSLLESGVINNPFGVGTGSLAGAGAIRKTTAGTVTVTAVALNVTGGLFIDNGVLSTDSAIGGSGTFSIGTNGGGATGGTLQYRGVTASLTRAVTLNDGGGTADVTQAATAYTMSSVVSGTGSLTKQGPGALVLTGNNTYQGGTTVSAGTLLANGQTGTNSGTGTGAVAVGGGGALGGSGRVAGAVSVASGGVIGGGDPTSTTANALTLNGGFTTSAGSTVGIRLLTTTPDVGSTNPASNSFLNVTGGTTTVHAGTLFLIDGTGQAFDPGQSYTYRIAAGAGDQSALNINSVATPGQFSTTNFSGPENFNFSVTGNGLGDVFLSIQPVPEPTAIIGLSVAALGLRGFVRRRSRGTAAVG